jgi:hypothetical protein
MLLKSSQRDVARNAGACANAPLWINANLCQGTVTYIYNVSMAELDLVTEAHIKVQIGSFYVSATANCRADFFTLFCSRKHSNVCLFLPRLWSCSFWMKLPFSFRDENRSRCWRPSFRRDDGKDRRADFEPIRLFQRWPSLLNMEADETPPIYLKLYACTCSTIWA